MNKKLLASLMIFGLSSSVLAGSLPERGEDIIGNIAASDAGVYVGLGLGYDNMTSPKDYESVILKNYIHANVLTSKIKKDNGFFGRVFVGYDINRNFAVEAGYGLGFHKLSFDFTAKDTASTGSKIYLSKNSLKRVSVADLAVKVKAPVADNFDLFAGAGVDLVFAKGVTDFTKDITDTKAAVGAVTKNKTRVGPMFMAGVDWSVNSNVIAGLEWRHYGIGRTDLEKSVINGVDTFTVSCRFKFDI